MNKTCISNVSICINSYKMYSLSSCSFSINFFYKCNVTSSRSILLFKTFTFLLNVVLLRHILFIYSFLLTRARISETKYYGFSKNTFDVLLLLLLCYETSVCFFYSRLFCNTRKKRHNRYDFSYYFRFRFV